MAECRVILEAICEQGLCQDGLKTFGGAWPERRALMRLWRNFSRDDSPEARRRASNLALFGGNFVCSTCLSLSHFGPPALRVFPFSP